MRPFITIATVGFFLPFGALADVPRVATDIAPVNGLVTRVMAGVGAPVQVVPMAGSVHNYDMRPSEAATLQSAEIVFWVGPSLTPWLERPLASLAGDATIVPLLSADGVHALPFREGLGHEDHSEQHEDHDADAHDDDHGHGHDADDTDPHAWLDPENAALWLGLIAETLAESDPQNAELYRANAAEGQEEIRQAAAAVAAELQSAGDIRYLIYHDSTQYFEDRFGLTPLGAVTAGDAAEPGPARIAELNSRRAATGTDCLLIESREKGALVDALSDAGELRIVPIDPLGIDLPQDADFYPRLLSTLADSFERCR